MCSAISDRVFGVQAFLRVILFIFSWFSFSTLFIKQLTSQQQNRTWPNRKRRRRKKLAATLYNSLLPSCEFAFLSGAKTFKGVATIYSWTLPHKILPVYHTFDHFVSFFGRTHLTSWNILNFFSSCIPFPHSFSDITSMSITLIANGLYNLQLVFHFFLFCNSRRIFFPLPRNSNQRQMNLNLCSFNMR